MTGPELYALTLSQHCEGPERCHWCGAACDRRWLHDEPPPTIGVKLPLAKYRSSPWICQGCWLFRRLRTTIKFLDGTYKDRQSAMNHSWWIDDGGAFALRSPEPLIYAKLLNPPKRFCLSITDGENILHLATVATGSPFAFLVNQTEMSFSVNDLKAALRNESDLPGTMELVRRFGPYELPAEPVRQEKLEPAGRGKRRG